MKRAMVVALSVVGTGWWGCASSVPPTADIPPRQQASAEAPRQHYAMEPWTPSDPCEKALIDAQAAFAAAYQKAGLPRLAFLANTPSAVAVRTGAPPDADTVSRGERRPAGDLLDEALPFDRAAVENRFIGLFQRLSVELVAVDLGVAGDRVRRESEAAAGREDTALVQELRSKQLCDWAILVTLRVSSRDDPVPAPAPASSTQVIVQAPRGDATVAAPVDKPAPPPVTLACTARAVRVSDGVVLATAVSERQAAGDPTAIGAVLDRLCVCAVADLAVQLADRP